MCSTPSQPATLPRRTTCGSATPKVDAIYDSLFRELLTYMMEDPRNITACTHLVFIAKNIERMGDLATNIAETIHFFGPLARCSTSCGPRAITPA